MKQVFFHKGSILVEDVPAPMASDGAVLVEVAFSLISVGTELAGVQSTGESLVRKALRQPEKVRKVVRMVAEQGLSETMNRVRSQTGQVLPSGYSCAGTVIDVGPGVTDIAKGDRVACAGAGYANHAEIVNVPRDLVARLPQGVRFEDGCSATVGAIALQGVRRAQNCLGETVAVIGLGLLGQLTVQIAKAAGCRVCAIDIDPARVELARQFGADFPINAGSGSPLSQVLDVTDAYGADSTIITAASQSDAIVQQAMEMTRKKGRVVVVGAVGLGLQRSPFYEKEIDFLISCSYGPGRYDPSYEEDGIDYPYPYVRWTENRNMQAYLGLIAEGKVDFGAMVDGVWDISDAPKAYASLQGEGGKKPLAVLLDYGKARATDKRQTRVHITPSAKIEGKIGVAVIGAGAFAQGVHLPHLKKLSDTYQLVAVSDIVGGVAHSAAKKFGAAYATTDWREVLSDDKVDLVVITTRHHLHAQLGMEAAKAGKAVLCEKPMAMNSEELEQLVTVIEETRVPYMVGFNRRFSPAAAQIKRALPGAAASRSPLVINYRVNAERLPPDSWVFGQEGGGRVIGEACHMFDFFNFLAESAVEGLDVQAVRAHGGRAVLRDNFSAILRYANGDVCTLTYASVGSDALGKEYVEVHCGGASFVIDNFKNLTGYGAKGVGWKSGSSQKGHIEELTAFAKCLTERGKWPISLEDLVSASRLSYEVADRIS